MLSIAARLYPDFSLLLLDLRSFGESQGSYTTFGIKERDDIKTALDFLEQLGYKHVGVFGFSLGGAVALLSAAGDSRIQTVASYGSFSDLRSLEYEAYSRLFVLKKPMVELMLLWGRIFFGESLEAVSPLRSAKNLNIATLLVHSRGDEQISFEHAGRLEAAFLKNKNTVLYAIEGKHGELPEEFYFRLKDFFTRALLSA